MYKKSIIRAMAAFITCCLYLACLVGFVISLSNWYFFFQSLKTKENHSPVGFIGGLIIYFSLYHLLPEKWQSAACLGFLIDISFPLFLLGHFFNVKK